MGPLSPFLLSLSLSLQLALVPEPTAIPPPPREREASLLMRKLKLDHILSLQTSPFSYQRAPHFSTGGQPLLIHLWSVHCPPCLKEMPELQALLDNLRETTPLRVVLITEDSLDSLEEYFQKNSLRLPAGDLFAVGAAGHLRVGIQQAQLPLTLLVDGQMTIRQAFIGSVLSRRNELLSAVDRLCSNLGSPCRAVTK